MRLRIVVLAMLAASLASSPASAIETYSSSQFRQVIAQALVPDRNDQQLYLSIAAGTLWANEIQRSAPADGIYYQYSGTVEIEAEGKSRTLQPGDGIFLAAGTKFVVRSSDPRPSPTYLQFLLSSTPEMAVTDATDGSSVELYRSPSPVPGLMHERNMLSLTRVPVPPQSLPDPLHRRTGAALHYILSGVGAESADGRTIARGPGSVSYEPAGYVYQWSNPGLRPLLYLLFNVNPKNIEPVVGYDERPADPFSRDPHLTWAIYCVAVSVALALIVSSGAMADFQRERRARRDRDDDHA